MVHPKLTPSQFLEAILPRGSVDYYMVYGKGSQLRQTSVKSIADLMTEAQLQNRNKNNVYYGTAAYTPNTNRKAENVAAKRCFHLDLDCGEGKPYATKQDAWRDFNRFVAETGIVRPNIGVDSGNGLHIYWILAEDITSARWRLYAEHLKTLCQKHNLHADHAVTADLARVMRIPSSVNWKDQDNPKRTPRAMLMAKRYSMQEFIDGFTNPPSETVVNFPDLMGDHGDLRCDYTDATPRFIERIASDCAVVKDQLETGGAHADYNLWFLTMNLAAFCNDGPQKPHDLSNKHASYNYDEVARVYEAAVEKKESGELRGAPRCETFSQFSKKCQKCPHFKDPERGVSWSSPIHFGAIQAKDDILTTVPPPGWIRTPKGFSKMVADDEGEFKSKHVFSGHIAKVEPMLSTDNVGMIAVQYKRHPEDDYDDLCLSLQAVASGTSELNVELTKQHVAMKPKARLVFGELLVDWYAKVRHHKRKRFFMDHMGWNDHDNRLGFGVGNDVYWSDGVHEPVHTADTTISKVYKTKGTLDGWKATVDKALQAKHIETEVMLATAFASPLVKFSDVQGCVISAVSAKSGTGKTTALKLAQAAWGHPVMGLNALDDTTNAIGKRLGICSSLPAFWDEVRIGKDNDSKFADFIYRTTQGREKSRMSVDTSIRESTSWKNLMVCTSNMSLYDQLSYSDSFTNASGLRVLEFPVSALDEHKRCSSLDLAGIDENYGHAGRVYAKWLVENKDEAQELFKTMWTKINKLMGGDSDARFVVSAAASIVAGATIAEHLGLVKFDVQGIANFLMQQLKRNRKVTTEQAEDAGIQTGDSVAIHKSLSKMVTNYMMEVSAQTVVSSHFTKKSHSVTWPKLTPVVMRLAAEERILVMEYKPFADWIQAHYKNSSMHLENMRREMAMVKKQGRLMSRLGDATTVNPMRTLVYFHWNERTKDLFQKQPQPFTDPPNPEATKEADDKRSARLAELDRIYNDIME